MYYKNKHGKIATLHWPRDLVLTSEAGSLKAERDIRESLTLYSHEDAAKSLKAKSKRDIDLYRKGVDAIENEWKEGTKARYLLNDPSIGQAFSTINKLKARTDEEVPRTRDERYLLFMDNTDDLNTPDIS
ncbi:hypothetical protein KI688_002744 [Linnemannia hyalina]|uniref:Uncharacterized protein n=1 Tax=Linnemannia hyalina TaxID=64524 RepID=A0A9P7XQT1_9FUNG|nr:hypothetical protein KI688_002744 [Linnemannia hyalina]